MKVRWAFCAERAAHGMAMYQGYLYILGGYSNNKGYSGNAWKLHVPTLLCSISRVSHPTRPLLVSMLHPLRA